MTSVCVSSRALSLENRLSYMYTFLLIIYCTYIYTSLNFYSYIYIEFLFHLHKFIVVQELAKEETTKLQATKTDDRSRKSARWCRRELVDRHLHQGTIRRDGG